MGSHQGKLALIKHIWVYCWHCIWFDPRLEGCHIFSASPKRCYSIKNRNWGGESSIQKENTPGRETKLHSAFPWVQRVPFLLTCTGTACPYELQFSWLFGAPWESFARIPAQPGQRFLCPAQLCCPCRLCLPCPSCLLCPRKRSPSAQLLVNKAIVHSGNKWQMLPGLGYFCSIWVFSCTQLSFLYLIISVLRNPALPKQPPHHAVHWLIFLFEEGLFVWPQYFPFFVFFAFFFPLPLWNDLCCRAEIVLLSYLELKGAFEPWPEADHGGKRCFSKTI